MLFLECLGLGKRKRLVKRNLYVVIDLILAQFFRMRAAYGRAKFSMEYKIAVCKHRFYF